MCFVFGQADPSTENSIGISNTASPNAAGFMRFQESPVNYYNGRSSFSIPIYEINAGGIKYPISLNYSHGGVQVNTMASDVGLGWSLSSCFINRTIIGDADLETIIDTRKDLNKKKFGFFDHQLRGNLIIDPLDISVDFYPDLFKFVSPTNSSSFYFKNKNEVVELNQKNTFFNWVIETKNYDYIKDMNGNWVNNDIDISDYSQFTLITKDGIHYSFQDPDISHSFTYFDLYETYANQFGSIDGTYPRVSTWNVSKISNLNNDEDIDFIYETYSSETSDYINDIFTNHPYYKYEAFLPYATVAIPENNIFFRSNPGDSNYGKYFNRLLKVQRIKKITFRGGTIEFNYDLNRQDLSNGKALTGIVVKDTNGSIIKEFELDYDYFTSNLQNNEFSRRLKLLSVREKGQNKYQFDYYEELNLPNIGSTLQDIFGFNNAIDTSYEPSTNQAPQYYYYPNKAEYSILPFNLALNTNHYLLDGTINKEPNEYSKIWSLKKVTFPTGGSNTYILESNTFNLWGNNLKGGGVRLKQQIIQEQESGSQRTFNYNYDKDVNTTSGYLFNMPQVGYPTSILFPVTDLNPNLDIYTGYGLKKYFHIFSNAKINYDVVNNFFIGYSKVEENENGIKTIYEFKNEEDSNVQTRSHIPYKDITQFPLHPIGEFLIKNSSYGNNIYIDNSYKRGKLKYLYYYDKNGVLQIKKENIYKGYEGLEEENLPNKNSYTGSSIYSDPNSWHIYELMQHKKSYNTIYNNLVYTKTTNYLPSGSIENESYMYYDINQNLLGLAHKIKNGETYPVFEVNKYFYPGNLPNEPYMRDLLDIYKDNSPVLVQSYSGEFNPQNLSNINTQNIIFQSKIEFVKNANTSNMIMPVKILAAVDQNDFYEIGVTFDRYDDKGNLLQSTKDGVSTTYIYGYKQLYPIAKIEGAKYQQVMSAIGLSDSNTSYTSSDIYLKSDLDIDEISENNLINELDTFRKTPALADYQITTYTYDPLVGITSVTPPSGMREVYIYEEVTKKLKEVKRMEKDENGNFIYRTIQENEYHYKP